MNQTGTILIIEDDRAIRRLVKNAMMANGYSVLEAETAKDGVRQEEQKRPDLILLDLGLPDHDGIEVIRYIRKRRITPIIIISARDRESDKVTALDMGADDYVTKPFGID
ncbi:MAG: response regulator, partial [Eubacterium sp.]|nr:response regulator [Eubacterium sp.]